MKLFLLSSLVLLLVQVSYAQTDTTSEFDIPPGAVVSKKIDLDKDFSGKLNELKYQNYANDSLKVNAKFIKDLTAKDWKNLEEKNPDEFEYYQRALSFYENLNPKVKHVFNTEELWFIYMFRQDIKEKIQNH